MLLAWWLSIAMISADRGIQQNSTCKAENAQQHKMHVELELLHLHIFISQIINEPLRDKTNKMRPAKTQIILGIRPVWSESSLYAQCVAKEPSFLHADSKDSDQTGRMPRPRPVWSEFSLGAKPHCWFCHQAAHFLNVSPKEKNWQQFHRLQKSGYASEIKALVYDR